MGFGGFPPAAFEFYERLTADNSRAFWQANKATYESAVKAPMVELCAELDTYGQFHVFRPNNDLRFAKDRPPYKTGQAAVSESKAGCGYYVQLSAEGLTVGAGYYMMAKDQLERFRDAVDDDVDGPEIEALTGELVRAGYSLGAHDELKTAPRGFAKDHPRIGMLRRSGLMAFRSWPPAMWMHSRKAASTVRDTWETSGALCAWLEATVGPTTLPRTR